MEVQIFKNKNGIYGFTENTEGSNLPSDQGPWVFQKSLESSPTDVGRIAVNSKDLHNDLETKGYHLVKPVITTDTKNG